MLAESGDTLRQARELTRCSVLVNDALGDATSQFRLNAANRVLSLVLVTRSERRLELLDERTDAADAGAVDLRAAVVAADTFLCLRRVRNRLASSRIKMKTARNRTAPVRRALYA